MEESENVIKVRALQDAIEAVLDDLGEDNNKVL
jgi:hypothetical protein